jgi:hypothetical protein
LWLRVRTRRREAAGRENVGGFKVKVIIRCGFTH